MNYTIFCVLPETVERH